MHFYAVNSQLYLLFRPKSSANQDAAVIAMDSGIKDINNWMCSDKLDVLNNVKTEFIIIKTRQQLS